MKLDDNTTYLIGLLFFFLFLGVFGIGLHYENLDKIEMEKVRCAK